MSDVSSGTIGRAAAQWIGGGLLSLAQVSGSDRLWMTWALEAERATGTLTIHDVNVANDEVRSETIEFGDIAALNVKRANSFWPDAKERSLIRDRPWDVVVQISFRRDSEEHQSRQIRLFIGGVDSREKVADFAYRLGCVLGLEQQCVVHSDPLRIEITMQREAVPGGSAMPAIDSPADYPHGRIAPAAYTAADRETPATWNPAEFPGETHVVEWSPRREIRIAKPFDPWALGCLPLALALLAAGPGVWFLIRDKVQQLGLVGTISSLAVASILGLLFGGLGLVYVFTSLPRRVTLAWAQRELRISRLLRTRSVPFERIEAIEIEWVLHGTSGMPVDTGPQSVEFSCAVQAVLSEGAGPGGKVELLSTKHFPKDPEAPYDAVLAPAGALAETLNVPLRVTPTSNLGKG